MSDIVDRLKTTSEALDAMQLGAHGNVCRDAATTIAQLREMLGRAEDNAYAWMKRYDEAKAAK